MASDGCDLGAEAGADLGAEAGCALGAASKVGPSKVRLSREVSAISPEIMPAIVAAPSATAPRAGCSTTGRRAKIRSIRARTACACAMPPAAITAWIRSRARPASSSARAETAERRSRSSPSIGSSASRVSVISGAPGTNHAAALASGAEEEVVLPALRRSVGAPRRAPRRAA